jgi:hypothetical protein
MAQKKFSEFTLQTVAQIIASPQYSFFYLVGHNEFSNENIKIPFSGIIDLVSSSLGAIVETGEITDTDVYELTTDAADYAGYPDSKVFVYLNGQEGYTSVEAVVDLSQGTITFPYQMLGTNYLRIVMFK